MEDSLNDDIIYDEKDDAEDTHNSVEIANFDDEEDNLPDFDALYEFYHNYMERYVWNNPIYHQLLFHVIIGQVFKNIKIMKGGVALDGRISLLLIQDQGTGKNTALYPFRGLTRKIQEEIGGNFKLVTTELDEFSDAAIIGSYVNKGYDPIKKIYIVEKVKGAFDKDVSNIITIKEAKTIFSRYRTQNSNIIQYINLALESIWQEGGTSKITKRLVSGLTECETVASLILTTFPTEDFSIETLNSGILRRLLVYYHRIPLSEKLNNTVKGFEMLRKNEGEVNKFNSEVIDEERIIAENIADRYREYSNLKEIQFNFDNSAVKYISDFVKSHLPVYQNFPDDAEQTLSSIVANYSDQALVIMAHRAIMCKRTNITKQDAEYAVSFIENLMVSVAKFVKYVYNNEYSFKHKKWKEEVDKKKINKIEKFIKNNGGKVLKKNLLKYIMTTMKKSKSNSYRDYKLIINRNIVREENGYVILN
jgi:hypothetical protein